MQSSVKLRLFADYFQFVLMDERSQGDFSTLWTEDALERMLAVGDCALAAGTLRNVEVDVEVEVLRARPEIVPGQWDNIVEASIRIPSGRLVVMGCTDYLPDAKRIDVESGSYQLLSLAGGIDSITSEWEPAHDLYKVLLWPGAAQEPMLIKSWKRRGTIRARE